MENEVLKKNLDGIVRRLNAIGLELYNIRSRRYRTNIDGSHGAWTNRKREDAVQFAKEPLLEALNDLTMIPRPKVVPSLPRSTRRSQQHYDNTWMYGLTQLALVDAVKSEQMAKWFRKTYQPSLRTRLRLRAGLIRSRLSYWIADNS